ncbi:MAG: hypothetical protein Q4F83_15435 [Eubacteriales bacterium]|nr:hypothetical protein [Eubacteriales bacterium]
MRRIRASFEKYRSKPGFAIFVNAVILAGLLLVFSPGYEVNDDVAICNFVNGVKGVFDAHLVYSNYVLGLLLAGLYRIKQSVPWYALLQYAVLFASFTSVFFVVSQRQKNIFPILVSLTVLLFFAYEGYIRLQYTKTAGIATAAGILLIFYSVSSAKIRMCSLIAGYLLACFGFMYRSPQFFAIAFLMTGIGLYQLLELKNEKKGQRLIKVFSYIKTFGLLLLLVAGLYLADHAAYRSPEWQEYLEYNNARTMLFDYGFPNYDKNREVYEELGLDENAFKLIRGWNFMDTEKFGLAVMEKLIALKEPVAVNRQFFKAFVKKVMKKLPEVAAFCCAFCLVLYWLFFSRHSWMDFVSSLYETGIVMFLYLFLFYQGRYLYNRVDVGIWLAVSLTVLWMFCSRKSRIEGICVPVFLIVCCLLIWGFTAKDSKTSDGKGMRHRSNNSCEKYLRTNVDRKANRAQKRAVIEKVESDKEHLYLAKVGQLSFLKSYGVFETPPFGIAENIAATGGWPAHTPVSCKVLQDFGITNPYRDMIGNEKVYLVDDKIDVTMQYIHTYYDPDAEAEVVWKADGCTVYQIK